MLLSIRNLTFGWNKNILFENISCDMPDGAINQIKGENGSGKSTLLQLIAGMIPHFSRGEILQGEIFINNRPIFHHPPKDFFPAIAYVPGTLLDFYLFTENLAQEILITRAITKTSTRNTKASIEEFSTIFPMIYDLLNVPFKTMNFDEKALALTLIFYIQEPQLFLFDEVINPSSSRSMQQWMSFFDCLAAKKCSVIFINHHHPFASYPCWILKNKTLVIA